MCEYNYRSSGARRATNPGGNANTQKHLRKCDLKKMDVKKKLICPTCRSSSSTIFIYEGAPTSGCVSQRCYNCGHLLFIDYEKMTLQDTER